MSHDNRFDTVEIDFMGGEPLLNFELIKRIVEWIEENPPTIPFICFATSNGTLLNDEKKAWMVEHKHTFWLGVSYDGTPLMQKINRGVELNMNALDFMHEIWPMQRVHITISKETLPHFAEGVLSLQRQGFPVEAALAQGIQWTTDDAILYREQLNILKDVYLTDATLPPINILAKQLFAVTPSGQQTHQKKFCGTGTQMITYDVDGLCYACHMFTPLVLGKDRSLVLSALDWSCDSVGEDPYCETCILKNGCPTCMGFNYRYRGDVAKRDQSWCQLVLVEYITACEFQVALLGSKIAMLTAEDAWRGQCAIEAYPFLATCDFLNDTSPFLS